MKKIISSLIIIFIMTAIASVCLAASTGTTTVDNLRLRKGASLDSEAIDVLNNGTKVNIISTEDDFYKVKIGEQTGYISKKYVKTGSSANSNTTNTTKNTTNTSNTSVTNNTSNSTKKTDKSNTTSNTKNTNSTSNTNTTNTNSTSNTNITNTVTTNTESETSNVTTNIATDTTNTNTDVTEVSSWSEEEINKANTTNLTSNTTLYALPLLSSTKLMDVPSGTQVLLISVNGKWAYVQTSSQSGWIDKSALKTQTVTVPGNSEAMNSENAN